MSNIKAIIFDVGGVLLRTEDRSSRARLEERLNLAPGQADVIVFNSEMGQKAQLGEVSSAEHWRWVQTHLGLSAAGLAEFKQAFFAGDRLDDALVETIRLLHGPYQTAIISNYMDDLIELVTDRYPMADAFDLIVGSAYEGIIKPDPIIFERTLERLGRMPAEAVFIDDFARNLEGARAVGLQAIHFTPSTNIRAELAAIGVAVLPSPD